MKFFEGGYYIHINMFHVLSLSDPLSFIPYRFTVSPLCNYLTCIGL